MVIRHINACNCYYGILITEFSLEAFIRILIILLVSVTNSNKCQGAWIKAEAFRL